MLGDTGENHPENWVGGLASPDLHAIVILFARDAAERGRCQMEHEKLIAQCEGVEVLSTLDLEATPPFDYAHDHFGYRDRLSQPVIEGTGETPTPGSGAPLKPGEFILGYPDETGPAPICRNRKSFPATAATWLIAACRNTSAGFATFSAARSDARGAGTRRGETDGPLAQRRAARAGARTKTIRHWAPTCSATTTSTTRTWTRTGMPCRSARTSAG